MQRVVTSVYDSAGERVEVDARAGGVVYANGELARIESDGPLAALVLPDGRRISLGEYTYQQLLRALKAQPVDRATQVQETRAGTPPAKQEQQEEPPARWVIPDEVYQG